jgi:comEA protein
MAPSAPKLADLLPSSLVERVIWHCRWIVPPGRMGAARWQLGHKGESMKGNWKTTLASAALITMLAGSAGTRVVEASQETKSATVASVVNLNTATEAELQALPGLGPAIAKRIVDYRQKSGGFKKVEDLMNVQGIGEKSFLRLKPLLTVAAPRNAER